MRRRLEDTLRRLWRGEEGFRLGALDLALLPLSLAFRGGVALRGAAYRRGILPSRKAGVPVVSVGNLTVGGTGKTPVTAWLARRIRDEGTRVAVLSRGYGADEIRLHERWNPDVPVLADPDRVAAARRAEEAGAEALLLDDGFQHRRLVRDLDVVLLAAEQPFPGRLLPRGPYREPAAALGRADAVVVTRRTATEAEAEAHLRRALDVAPHLTTARIRLVPGGWREMQGGRAEISDPDLLAVTGVAAPEAFRSLVGELTGTPPELMAFPDHHPFDAADAERIARAAGPRTVVVTEKDAVKLEPLARLLPPILVLPLEVRPDADAERLVERILKVARKAEEE